MSHSSGVIFDQIEAGIRRMTTAQEVEEHANRIAELLQAAITFKNYADDRYNKDPRSCAIINTPIQQRLWLAIDAVREGK